MQVVRYFTRVCRQRVTIRCGESGANESDVAGREREILEHPVQAIAEQAAKAHEDADTSWFTNCRRDSLVSGPAEGVGLRT